MNDSLTWERTFVMIKPDGVRRSLIGTILGRFERAGLTITGLKLVKVDRDLAERHYGSRDKTWIKCDLCEYQQSAFPSSSLRFASVTAA